MRKPPPPQDETPTRAAAYVRVSTAEQAREGFSLEEQRRRMEARIAAEGWELAGIYVDAGVSGRRDDRPELRRLLADAEGGAFERVVITKLDRLGRSQRFLLDVYDRLGAAGVGLLSLGDSIDTGTASGKLMRNVLSSLAEFESDVIGERVAAVTAARAAEGRFPGGRFPPYGYRRERGQGIVPDPAQAVVVRRIFRETLAGRSQREIVRRLDADGIPTQNGARWTQGTIRRILAADVYRGAVEVKGVVCEDGQHEAIVERKLWDEVAHLRASRRAASGGGRGRRPAGRHLFTHGLLRCGSCGGAMSPRRYHKGTEVYECRDRRERGVDSCPMPPIARERIDVAMLGQFEQVQLDVDATREHVGAQLSRALSATVAARKRAELDEQRVRGEIARVRRDYLSAELSASSYEDLSAQLRGELEGAQAEAARLSERERQVAQHAADRDAEEATLRRLVALRNAVAGRVRDAEGIDALRAVLRSTFERVVLEPTPTSLEFERRRPPSSGKPTCYFRLLPHGWAAMTVLAGAEPRAHYPEPTPLRLDADNELDLLKFDSA